MTREEFIGRAADALMKHCSVVGLIPCVDAAEAALEAVGAWDLLDAAIGARSLVEELEAGGCPDVRRYGWGDRLREAIAKAEGR